MTLRVAAAHAYVTADAHGRPLVPPQPLDLAREEIPYGARARLEVELDPPEATLPLGAKVLARLGDEEWQYGMLSLFPTGDPGVSAVEIGLPWGPFWHGDDLPCGAGAPRCPASAKVGLWRC